MTMAHSISRIPPPNIKQKQAPEMAEAAVWIRLENPGMCSMRVNSASASYRV